MNIQFPEHKNGSRSGDAKVAKLDKLARLMNVMIHIDGIPYGMIPKEEKIIVPEEPEVIETVETVSKPASKTKSAPKPRTPRKPKES